MNFTETISILNKRLTKKNPPTFTSLRIKINSPALFRFIKKEIKTKLGDTDWDYVTKALDPVFQRRWIGEKGRRRMRKLQIQKKLIIHIKIQRLERYVILKKFTDHFD